MEQKTQSKVIGSFPGSGAARLGGLLVIVVSTGLAVTLPARGVDYNALNLFTMILAAAGGLLAVRASRRMDASGLGWGTALLLLAMVPTVFGWVVLLYLPAFVLLLIAVCRFVSAPEDN